MRYHAQLDSWRQIPLALGRMEIPASESALLKAYRRLEISRRLSFEQVMSDPAYAIGVRNLADAILRRGITGCARNGNRTDAQPAQDMDTLFARSDPFHDRTSVRGNR